MLGYFGHMWELYAMWTWIAAFATASLAERATPGVGSLVASSPSPAARWAA